VSQEPHRYHQRASQQSLQKWRQSPFREDGLRKALCMLSVQLGLGYLNDPTPLLACLEATAIQHREQGGASPCGAGPMPHRASNEVGRAIWHLICTSLICPPRSTVHYHYSATLPSYPLSPTHCRQNQLLAVRGTSVHNRTDCGDANTKNRGRKVPPSQRLLPRLTEPNHTRLPSFCPPFNDLVAPLDSCDRAADAFGIQAQLGFATAQR